MDNYGNYDFFPVYKDEKTVEIVTEKSIAVLQKLTDDYEVLIIDDCSPDRSGEIADGLVQKYPGIVRVIHHETNKGYGASVRAGLHNARHDWVCFTDGDNEYDVYDLLKMYLKSLLLTCPIYREDVIKQYTGGGRVYL